MGVPTSDTVRKHVRASGCVLVCACLRIAAFAQITAADGRHMGTRSTHMGYSEYSHMCADLCRRRHTWRRLHGQAASSGAILPIDPDISFIRTPTGKRSAAQHGATTECHEPTKTTASACKAEEGVRLGQCHCHAGPVPCPAPCPAPDHQMADPSPRPCVDSRGMALARQAYRVGQWPPRPCMHSRRVSSARVIPWHFRFVFLVLQHVTGPATLVSTSGVCSPSLVSTPSTQM